MSFPPQRSAPTRHPRRGGSGTAPTTSPSALHMSFPPQRSAPTRHSIPASEAKSKNLVVRPTTPFPPPPTAIPTAAQRPPHVILSAAKRSRRISLCPHGPPFLHPPLPSSRSLNSLTLLSSHYECPLLSILSRPHPFRYPRGEPVPVKTGAGIHPSPPGIRQPYFFSNEKYPQFNRSQAQNQSNPPLFDYQIESTPGTNPQKRIRQINESPRRIIPSALHMSFP